MKIGSIFSPPNSSRVGLPQRVYSVCLEAFGLQLVLRLIPSGQSFLMDSIMNRLNSQMVYRCHFFSVSHLLFS